MHAVQFTMKPVYAVMLQFLGDVQKYKTLSEHPLFLVCVIRA